MGQKTIFRSVEVEEDPFTRIRNAIIWEEDLSAKATFWLILLLSLPDDWKVSFAHLKGVKTDGEAAVRSAVDELRDAGYVHHFQNRDDSGEFSGHVYLVFNESVSRAKASRLGFPGSGNTGSGKMGSHKSDTTNKTFQQTKEGTNKRERDTHTHGRESAGEPPLSEEDAVSVAEDEDIPAKVAKKWWHHHNARGWDRPIKSVRSALIKWNLNEEDFHGNGEVESPEDLKGKKFTELEVDRMLSRFEDLSRSDFGYAQEERGGDPLYTLTTEPDQ